MEKKKLKRKKALCLYGELHSDVYVPSHSEGAGTKSSLFSALTVRFVKNHQAEESIWSDKVILIFKELRVGKAGVRALVPPQELIIYIENWNLKVFYPRKRMDIKANIPLMKESLLHRMKTFLRLTMLENKLVV